MSHSLNNPNKEHFMNRTGSYSTHGSRRGFVDDGIPDHEKTEVDEYGTVWHPVVRKGL